MTQAQPNPAARWRSLLFVPAHVPRFVGRAHERGADAVIRGDDAWSWGDELAGRYYAGVGIDDDDGPAIAEDGRESE